MKKLLITILLLTGIIFIATPVNAAKNDIENEFLERLEYTLMNNHTYQSESFMKAEDSGISQQVFLSNKGVSTIDAMKDLINFQITSDIEENEFTTSFKTTTRYTIESIHDYSTKTTFAKIYNHETKAENEEHKEQIKQLSLEPTLQNTYIAIDTENYEGFLSAASFTQIKLFTRDSYRDIIKLYETLIKHGVITISKENNGYTAIFKQNPAFTDELNKDLEQLTISLTYFTGATNENSSYEEMYKKWQEEVRVQHEITTNGVSITNINYTEVGRNIDKPYIFKKSEHYSHEEVPSINIPSKDNSIDMLEYLFPTINFYNQEEMIGEDEVYYYEEEPINRIESIRMKRQQSL